jgi:hypothetical protein
VLGTQKATIIKSNWCCLGCARTTQACIGGSHLPLYSSIVTLFQSHSSFRIKGTIQREAPGSRFQIYYPMYINWFHASHLSDTKKTKFSIGKLRRYREAVSTRSSDLKATRNNFFWEKINLLFQTRSPLPNRDFMT